MQVLTIGSPHGDDQVGWRVAELLRGSGVKNVHVVQNVDQLLWYLTPDRETIIVDACQSGAPAGTQFRFEWPDPGIEARGGITSHGIDVPYALRLAEVLAKLPRELVLYAIEINTSLPTQEIAPEVNAAAHELAVRIQSEIAAREGGERCMNDL